MIVKQVQVRKLPRALPALTGARFFAALSVLLLHTSSFIHFPQPLRAIAMQGRNGVSFFFLLSGFILSHTYGEQFKQFVDPELRKKFLVHRFARVYPLHLLVFFAITPIGILLYGHTYRLSTAIVSWLSNFALVQSWIPSAAFGQIWNAPAWSISCEAFFYLMFPWIISGFCSKITSTTRLAGASIAVYLLSAVIFVSAFLFWSERGLKGQPLEGAMEFWVYRNPVCRLGEFVLGCCLYLVVCSDFRSMRLMQTSKVARDAILFVSIGWLLFLSFICALGEFDVSVGASALHTSCWYLLPAPAFCALIATLASGETFLTPLLTQRSVILLGEASYAIYMLHWIAWGPLTKYPGAPFGWKILAILAILPFSIVVFEMLEKPARNFIRARWQ